MATLAESFLADLEDLSDVEEDDDQQQQQEEQDEEVRLELDLVVLWRGVRLGWTSHELPHQIGGGGCLSLPKLD